MPGHARTSAAFQIPGLTEREAAIWLVLSKRGALNISEIATATELHRPAIYQLLPHLIEVGLVEETRARRRTTYQTTGPRVLEKWRASHDQAFAEQMTVLKKSEGELLPKEVRLYRGREIGRVWEDIVQDLPKGSVFYRYDGYAPGTTLSKYVPAKYLKTLQAKRLERFVITNGGLRKSVYRKRIECASHMLPASFDAFEQGVIQFATEEKIACIDLHTETAFVISNAAIAKYHVKLFQYLYRSLPE